MLFANSLSPPHWLMLIFIYSHGLKGLQTNGPNTFKGATEYTLAVPLLSVRTWDKELQNYMINTEVQPSNNKLSLQITVFLLCPQIIATFLAGLVYWTVVKTVQDSTAACIWKYHNFRILQNIHFNRKSMVIYEFPFPRRKRITSWINEKLERSLCLLSLLQSNWWLATLRH